MNLTGFISVATWDSNLYILVVIKVSYHYLVKKLLKDKNEIGVAVQNIISILEY